jgi:vacuolar protein sorting-associated protein 53
VSAAILILLKELENACDPAFNVMSRLSWSTVSLVSGQSSYVDDLVKSTEQVADTVKPLIDQKKYLRNIFDKVVRLVCLYLPLYFH